MFYRPKEISKIAKETQCIQRERKLNATVLIKLFFKEPGIIVGKSLTKLCSALSKQGVYISKEGLNKQFDGKMVLFLNKVYLRLFETQLQLKLNKTLIKSTVKFTRVRIMDGTTVKLPDFLEVFYPGTVGAAIKFQLEYDCLTGQLMYVEMQEGKAGDCPSGMKRLENVEPGELFLQDLGYFKYDLLEKIEESKAFYVSRAKSDTMFYVDHPELRYHKNGEIIKASAYERLYLEEELKTMKRGELREFPKVYLGKNKLLPSRLVIYRKTEEEEAIQNHRIKRRNQTKPGEIKQKSYDLASISMYVTCLPPTVPAKEIVALYKYRWQIELLFKSWKSDLKVAEYRNMKVERWECHFWIELIILLISTIMTHQLRIYFWEEKEMILSEAIAIREISDRIDALWQARAAPTFRKQVTNLIKLLSTIGKKNVKKPGPLGWER